MVKVPNAVADIVSPADMHDQQYGNDAEILKALMEGRQLPNAEDNRGMML